MAFAVQRDMVIVYFPSWMSPVRSRSPAPSIQHFVLDTFRRSPFSGSNAVASFNVTLSMPSPRFVIFAQVYCFAV